MGRGTRWSGVGVVVAVVLALAGPARAAPTFDSGNGLTVVSSEQLSPRLFTVKLTTPALADRPVDVRVLLPDGYDAQPQRRWPVLWLFHGTSGRAADWTTMGDAEAATAGRPLIVVMPDAGFDGDGGGWFTNWFNGGAGGPPRWETFHIDQLIPWADRVLRTDATRRGRAIYGLSQGGFGSLSYAARHPDLFVAAGAFSGAVETSADPRAQALTTPVVQATAFGLDGSPDPDAMFGPRATQEVNWRAHDPGTLAPNLRGMDVRLWTGDGRPGPLDGPEPNPGAIAIEGGVHELNALFTARLQDAAIPHAYRDYGPGTHSWTYWARDLKEALPELDRVFAQRRADPAVITYRSTDSRFTAFGWDVAIERPARELATLADASARGFTLSGSGTAIVLTPRVFIPGATATVRVHSPATDRTEQPRAGEDGRLRIAVPLGPGNADQQFTAGSVTRVFTAQVTIDGPTRRPSCPARTLRVIVPRGTRSVTARVDGAPRRATRRGRRVAVRLPALAAGPHEVVVTARAAKRRAVLVRRTVRC